MNTKQDEREGYDSDVSDWFIGDAPQDAHRFQSMHGTNACWHCDHDAYHHSSPAPGRENSNETSKVSI